MLCFYYISMNKFHPKCYVQYLQTFNQTNNHFHSISKNVFTWTLIISIRRAHNFMIDNWNMNNYIIKYPSTSNLGHNIIKNCSNHNEQKRFPTSFTHQNYIRSFLISGKMRWHTTWIFWRWIVKVTFKNVFFLN